MFHILFFSGGGKSIFSLLESVVSAQNISHDSTRELVAWTFKVIYTVSGQFPPPPPPHTHTELPPENFTPPREGLG